MKILEGTLETVSLAEIFRLAESGSRTGGLTVSREGISKTFFFQRGKLIFASSQKVGERIGEFFTDRFGLDRGTLCHSITESVKRGIPFTEYIVSHRIVDIATLTHWVTVFIGTILADALSWDSGSFIFTNELPAAVMNGPVKIDIASVLKKSLKGLHYEAEKVWSSGEVERAYQGIVQKISEKNLELPVVPAMTCRLNELIRSDSASVHDIARLIMSDQVLTAKILKVANSVFYGSFGRITSLQQAIITMGFRTIESIATMHALSSIPVKDASRVNQVLEHSLYCALIARRAAADFCLDPEESFVCGLLHDIGKTVLLDIAADYPFPEAAVSRLLEEFHQRAGALLVLKWNFPDIVWSSVLYHHAPWDAPSNAKMAEAVCLADLLAHDSGGICEVLPRLTKIAPTGRLLKEIVDDLPAIRETTEVF